MIATVDVDDGVVPCVVKWTGKDGWVTVSIITWCGIKVDASDHGVTQYPDGIPTCPACKAEIDKFKHRLGLR